MLGQNLISLSTEFNLDCLELLLKYSNDIVAPDVDLKDSFGRAPLHHGAANCDPSAVKLLVQHGFSHFQDQDMFGYTPLQIACMRGK